MGHWSRARLCARWSERSLIMLSKYLRYYSSSCPWQSSRCFTFSSVSSSEVRDYWRSSSEPRRDTLWATTTARGAKVTLKKMSFACWVRISHIYKYYSHTLRVPDPFALFIRNTNHEYFTENMKHSCFCCLDLKIRVGTIQNPCSNFLFPLFDKYYGWRQTLKKIALQL